MVKHLLIGLVVLGILVLVATWFDDSDGGY